MIKRQRKKAQASNAEQLPVVATDRIDEKLATALLLFQNKRVTPKGLEQYLRRLHSLIAPHLVPKLYEALISLTQSGNAEAVKMGLQAYGILSQPGGVTVNTMQVNQNGATSTSGRNFDSVIRRIADAEAVIDVTPEQAP